MALKTLTTSGKWITNTNWTPAAKPTATDEVLIPTGKEVKIEAAAKCRALMTEGTAVVAGFENLEVGDATAPTEAAFKEVALKIAKTSTWSFTGFVKFVSTSATTLQVWSGEKTLANGEFAFTTKGKWKLEEPLTVTAGMEVTAGTLETNGKTVEVQGGALKVTGTTTLDITSSTIKLTGIGTGWTIAEASTLVSTGSTIEITNTSASEKTFSGAGKTYAALSITGGNVKVEGNNTFSTLKLNNAGKEATKFKELSTQTVTTFEALGGKAGSLVKMESTVAGKEWKLTKASGNVNVDFIEVKDSHVDASPKWYGGPVADSTYGTGNLNWLEEAEPSGSGVVGKGTGTMLLTGSAAGTLRSVVLGKATGPMLLTGTATGIARNIVTGKGTGALLLRGTGTGLLASTVTGKATGTLVLTGSGKAFKPAGTSTRRMILIFDE